MASTHPTSTYFPFPMVSPVRDRDSSTPLSRIRLPGSTMAGSTGWKKTLNRASQGMPYATALRAVLWSHVLEPEWL